MSKIKINVEVKKEGKTLREFKNLEVKLWDTAKENVGHYGEELLHLCFIGTSGKVNIQNKIRSFASATDDGGNFVNDDQAVEKFAIATSVTVGSGSELQSERASLEAGMDAKELKLHNEAMAYAAKFQTQLRDNVKGRKGTGEEKAQ